MSAAGMQLPISSGTAVKSSMNQGNPLAPGMVQSLDQAMPNNPINYVTAYSPNQPDQLNSDPGVTTVIDPNGQQVQVPVVSQTIAVEKTAPGVIIALGAIVAFLFFKGRK